MAGVDRKDKPGASVPEEGCYETINVQFFPDNYFRAQTEVKNISALCIPNSMGMHPLEIEVQKSNILRRQNQSVIQTAKQHIMLNEANKSDNEVKVNHIIWQENEVYGDTVENCHEIKADSMALESEIPLTVQFCIEADSANKSEASSDDDFDQTIPVFDHEPDPDIKTIVSEKDSDITNSCYMCFKKFKQKKNMYAHIRKIHSSQPKIQGGIICPMCEMHSLRHEHLRQHLESLHSVKIQKEEKMFSTIEEFNEWKATIEEETFSCFVSKGSSKLLAGIQTKSYFKCHRSGASPIRMETKKRKRKKQGSYKIGVTCPAAIEVTENVHGMHVTYWSTHIGHSVLSEETDRLKVQGLLESGMAWDQILELVQSEEKSISLKSCDNSVPSLPEDKKASSSAKKQKTLKSTKSVEQSTLIEKTGRLLNFLETTEVAAPYRLLISNMIDNLASIVKRRSIESEQNSFKSVIKGTYSNTSGGMPSVLMRGLGRGRESTKHRKMNLLTLDGTRRPEKEGP